MIFQFISSSISCKRYVDIFFLFSFKLHVTNVLNCKNFKTADISFTVQPKKNNLFQFLNTKIFRYVGKFRTSVDRKPTFSGSLTDFELLLPTSYKYNFISTLFHCGFVISFSYMSLLDKIFKSNGYLKGLLIDAYRRI